MAVGPQVKDFMTPAPITIEIDQDIDVARQLMQNYECRHLPVLDGETLVGIISDRDVNLANSLLQSGETPLVRDVYVSYPYTAEPTTALEKVLRDMVDLHISSTLVVEDGKLAGIFTSIDACTAFAEFLAIQREQ